jgi:glycosyltransferase involved in cell wall biosynthesis
VSWPRELPDAVTSEAMVMRTMVVVPAFEPSEALVDLVAELQGVEEVDAVVVVDDGSGPEYASTFERVARFKNTKILRHALNLGKGAALKTGINACLCDCPDAVIVTADADGQHLTNDIQRVARLGRTRTDALVLGVRDFRGDVPLRSRVGNELTRHILRLVLGYALLDTQTGLRALPAALARHVLKLASRGYEFELDMLIACKQLSVPIVQTRIETVYLNRNATSHFNPLLDSMRIYFALLRFTISSLTTSLIDNLAFALLYWVTFAAMPTGSALLVSQAGGRLVACVYNYTAVKRLVFASRARHARALPKYVLLVVASGATSYMMISYLVMRGGVSVFAAKVLVESFLFLPNFVIQRDLVFLRAAQDELFSNAR